MINFLSFLFSETFFYILIGIIGLIIISYIYTRIPESRIFIKGGIITIVCGVMLISAIWCGYQINGYYSASGGIFGKISEYLGVNVKETEDLTFEIENLVLKQDMYERYSATVTIDKKITLESDENYAILINDSPTTTLISSITNISSSFNYQFYNDEDEKIFNDTLNINVAFQSERTDISIYTYGKNDSIRYWQKYIKKNGFTLKIIKDGYSKNSNFEFVEGESPKICKVEYYKGQTLYTTQYYLPGQRLKDIPTIDMQKDIYFGDVFYKGWQDNQEKELYEGQEVWHDIVASATTETLQTGYFNTDNKKLIYSWEDLENKGLIQVKDLKLITVDSTLNQMLYINNNISSIEEDAFENSNLDMVNLKYSHITRISMNAFRNSYVKNIILIVNGDVNVLEYAFRNCSKLQSIFISKSVIQMGSNAFYGSNSDLKICVEENVNKSIWAENWNYNLSSEFETIYNYTEEGYQLSLRENFRVVKIRYLYNDNEISNNNCYIGQPFIPLDLICVKSWTDNENEYKVNTWVLKEHYIVKDNLNLKPIMFEIEDDNEDWILYNAKEIKGIDNDNRYNIALYTGSTYYHGTVVYDKSNKSWIFLDFKDNYVSTINDVNVAILYKNSADETIYLNKQTKEHGKVKFDYYLYKNQFCYNGKIIFLDKSKNGVFKYDILNNSTTQIYLEGTWDTLELKEWSVFVGAYATVRIKSTTNKETYLIYDMRDDSITLKRYDEEPEVSI